MFDQIKTILDTISDVPNVLVYQELERVLEPSLNGEYEDYQRRLKFQIMAYYKVSVDVSDLFDDMLVQAQKSFLIDKFCSLATDQQIEVVSEMLENLNGDQVAKVIEDAFDNLHEQGQEQVINYVNE